jgi:predicted transcriptional regulator
VKLIKPTDFDILQEMSDGERHIAPNLAEVLDRDRQYINNRLAELAGKGVLEKVGPSKRSNQYTITDKGLITLQVRSEYEHMTASEFGERVMERLLEAQQTKGEDHNPISLDDLHILQVLAQHNGEVDSSTITDELELREPHVLQRLHILADLDLIVSVPSERGGGWRLNFKSLDLLSGEMAIDDLRLARLDGDVLDSEKLSDEPVTTDRLLKVLLGSEGILEELIESEQFREALLSSDRFRTALQEQTNEETWIQ